MSKIRRITMRKRRIAVELFAMMIAVTGVFHGSMKMQRKSREKPKRDVLLR